MIDIHFHGLPCVDDGPDNQESAIKLLRKAYQQGAREIVVTPHMHHPMSFGHIPLNEQMQAGKTDLFQTFFNQVKCVLPDLILHEGAEMYISRKHLGGLDQLTIKTIGNTDYILVEFSRRITYHQMDTLLHGLHLLGWKPIIAHLEEYGVVCKNIDHIKALDGDNYVIQVNAMNILDRKTKNGQRAKQLIELGVVDVVASDAHNLRARSPRMAEAKMYITRTFGKAIAKQWLTENPTRILKNQSVIKEYTVPKKKYSFFLGFCGALFVVLMVVNVLAKKIEIPMFPDQGILATNEAKLAEAELTNGVSESVGEMEEPKVEISEEKNPVTKINPETNPIGRVPLAGMEMPPVETDPEDKKLDSKGNGLTHEETLIESYTTYLGSLQESYLEAVDGCYIQLRDLKKTEDKMEQEAAANRIVDEIATLESQADNKVYKALYDMQNDLEEYDYDVEIVHTSRQHYLEMKVKISNEYEAKLQN